MHIHPHSLSSSIYASVLKSTLNGRGESLGVLKEKYFSNSGRLFSTSAGLAELSYCKMQISLAVFSQRKIIIISPKTARQNLLTVLVIPWNHNIVSKPLKAI